MFVDKLAFVRVKIEKNFQIVGDLNFLAQKVIMFLIVIYKINLKLGRESYIEVDLYKLYKST